MSVVAAVLFGVVTGDPAPVSGSQLTAGSVLDSPVRAEVAGVRVTVPPQDGWRVAAVSDGQVALVHADGTRLRLGAPEMLWERDRDGGEPIPVPWSSPQQLLDWLEEPDRRSDVSAGLPEVDPVAGRSVRRMQLRSADGVARSVGQLTDGTVLRVGEEPSLVWQLQLPGRLLVVWAEPPDGGPLDSGRVLALVDGVRVGAGS